MSDVTYYRLQMCSNQILKIVYFLRILKESTNLFCKNIIYNLQLRFVERIDSILLAYSNESLINYKPQVYKTLGIQLDSFCSKET